MDSRIFVLFGVAFIILILFTSAEVPLEVTWGSGSSTGPASEPAVITVPFPGFEPDAVPTIDESCKDCQTILECLACLDKKFVQGVVP